MKYRVISDTHFEHKMLIDIGDRVIGFEKKIMNSLSQINDNDVLIHIGDISIGNDAYIHEEYISKIKCKKILVKGNHDTKSNNWYYEHGRDLVVDSFQITFNKLHIHFTHKPDTREGYVNIHGHLHKYKNRHGVDANGDDANRILFSCEYENMQARTLDYIIERHRKKFNI